MANNAQTIGSVEVEMSAYVLLALLSGPSLPGFGLNYSAGIVHWLSKQQNAYGGFSSTQVMLFISCSFFLDILSVSSLLTVSGVALPLLL